MTSPIRVLLADDHLIIRNGLRMIIETAADIECVGEACNGQEAIMMAQEYQPDVILMDLQMPIISGIEAIERIKAEQAQTAIVILTTFNEDDLLIKGLRAGACAFLLKDTDHNSLKETIRAAASGKSLITPAIMERLLSFSDDQVVVANKDLTDRELEVLQLAADGLRSKEIAVNLAISERTVKAHLTSIYNKLGVDSRAAAIASAMKQGIL
jgi:NarL family two-component system response regulator YdfI